MINNTLLFFLTCDKQYKQFIIPYIYFANKYNPNSFFEIIVDNFSNELKENLNKLKLLIQNNNILIYEEKNKNIQFNRLRFLKQPKTKCTYTYIGDIDIFITENILQFHIQNLQNNKTIFDNQIRITDNNRLSGLHFVKTQEYYNNTKQTREKYLKLNTTIGDEILLKNICQESKLIFPKISHSNEEFCKNRPIHGIHLSLNRKPFKNTLEFPKNEFITLFLNKEYNLSEFQKCLNLCDKQFLNTLNMCINYCN